MAWAKPPQEIDLVGSLRDYVFKMVSGEGMKVLLLDKAMVSL